MNVAAIISFLKQAPYFSKQNLALVLKKDSFSLDYWVNKLIKQKLIIPLKKGLYISTYYKDLVTQNPSESESYFEYLANTVRMPSYLSLEYVLSKSGMIPEAVYAYTSITNKTSRTYATPVGTFIYKTIKPQLFLGWTIKPFRDKQVYVATKAKALFDYLYLKSFAYQNDLNTYLLNDARFNWLAFTNDDLKEFQKYVRLSKSQKVNKISSLIKKIKHDLR